MGFFRGSIEVSRHFEGYPVLIAELCFFELGLVWSRIWGVVEGVRVRVWVQGDGQVCGRTVSYRCLMLAL